ncbi:hypothetical protein FQA39_LY01320 [Lamprigera yunnana]|nr:hypothetical protein FQA39_LY01320 [Lamprigera yunnana]
MMEEKDSTIMKKKPDRQKKAVNYKEGEDKEQNDNGDDRDLDFNEDIISLCLNGDIQISKPLTPKIHLPNSTQDVTSKMESPLGAKNVKYRSVTTRCPPTIAELHDSYYPKLARLPPTAEAVE